MQNIDFGMTQIVVQDGEGAKDRVTILPIITKSTLARRLRRVKSSGPRPARFIAPSTAR